jgi:hypothetical protein
VRFRYFYRPRRIVLSAALAVIFGVRTAASVVGNAPPSGPVWAAVQGVIAALCVLRCFDRTIIDSTGITVVRVGWPTRMRADEIERIYVEDTVSSVRLVAVLTGRSPKTITAELLPQVAGGRFSRISDAVATAFGDRIRPLDSSVDLSLGEQPSNGLSRTRVVWMVVAAVAAAAAVAGVLVAVLARDHKTDAGDAMSAGPSRNGFLTPPPLSSGYVLLSGPKADKRLKIFKESTRLSVVDDTRLGLYGDDATQTAAFEFIGGETSDLPVGETDPDFVIDAVLGEAEAEAVDSRQGGAAKCNTISPVRCVWVDGKTFAELVFVLPADEAEAVFVQFRNDAEN